MKEEIKEKGSGKLPTWLIVLLVFIVIVFAGISLSGFFVAKITSKVLKTVAEQKTGAKLEIGSTAKWPSDIPAEIPKLTGGKIVGAIKTDNAWSVIVSEIDDTTVQSYVSQLKSLGWEAKLEMVSEVTITQLEKDSLQIALAYDASSKGLNLTITSKE